MKFNSDVDIDFADRNHILDLIKHIPASIIDQSGSIKPHNSGIYVSPIPIDPVSNRAAIDYKSAENRGYTKLDFLNVGVYSHVKSEDHLNELLSIDPPWVRLLDRDFCSKLIHIGDHYDSMIKFTEPVNSIERLAMFLAVIRPAKRHLIGKPWKEVSKTVWAKPDDGSYIFKKSHSCAYAHLVSIHMHILNQQGY